MEKKIGVNSEGNRVRKALAEGVTSVAELVQATMGPMGKSIIIERSLGSPIITKDGYTVAESIRSSDTIKSVGVQLCKRAALETNAKAGDGTTTAVVLTDAMVREGLRLVTSGYQSTLLCKGMNLAVQKASTFLQDLSEPADSIEKIMAAAAISAKDPKLGDIVAHALDTVGPNGIIMVRESKEQRTSVGIFQGMEIGRGLVSPAFLTQDTSKQALEMEDVAIYLSELSLETVQEAEKIVNWAIWARKNLLIIAKEFKREALNFLVNANKSGKLQVAGIQAPEYGLTRLDALEDIAASTGATVISAYLGNSLSEAKSNVLGNAKKVTVDNSRTIIAEPLGHKEAVDGRIRSLKALLGQETIAEPKEQLKKRIAALAGGVAIIRVGGTTPAAMSEQKYRVEDAVFAAQAAVQTGILPGGGTALFRCGACLEEWSKMFPEKELQLGISLVASALTRPLKQISHNAGRNVNFVAKTVAKGDGWYGYDAKEDTYGPMLEAGIVDPLLVVETAMSNAASIAVMILSTEGFVADPTDGRGSEDYASRMLEDLKMTYSR